MTCTACAVRWELWQGKNSSVFWVGRDFRVPLLTMTINQYGTVELSNPAIKNIPLGSLRVGDVSRKELNVVNRSRIPVRCVFSEDTLRQLERNFVSTSLCNVQVRLRVHMCCGWRVFFWSPCQSLVLTPSLVESCTQYRCTGFAAKGAGCHHICV